MYRTKKVREATRSTCKTDKFNWFKKCGFTNTLTIPTTPGGKLASLVMEILEKCQAPGGTETKVVEREGRSVISEVVRRNPFPRTSCRRSNCPPEVDGGKLQSRA